MSWQSIETGPKDGTRVLLMDEHKRVFFGRYVDSEDFEYGKSVRRRQEWWAENMFVGFRSDPPKFTHWMAIPAAD